MKITKKTLIEIIKEEIKNNNLLTFPVSDHELKFIDNEKLMDILYNFRNIELDKEKLYKIINKIKSRSKSQKYNTPDDWFEKKEYKTFMEFFKRKLSKEKFNQIKSNRKNIIAFPCESIIESMGNFADLIKNKNLFTIHYKRSAEKSGPSLLKLKKYTDTVVEDLKSLGLKNIESMSFLNLKLMKEFYHRIHSPVDGKINSVIEIKAEDKFFGDNILWIVEILTADYGKVYLLLVGELSIQDFEFKINVNDQVRIYDEIGNFDWASQVILIYDSKYFKNINPILQINRKYFIGDSIFEG